MNDEASVCKEFNASSLNKGQVQQPKWSRLRLTKGPAKQIPNQLNDHLDNLIM